MNPVYCRQASWFGAANSLDLRIPALLVLLALAISPPAARAQTPAPGGLHLDHLVHPDSGQPAGGYGQTGITGELLPEPLALVVLDDKERPVPGITVNFDLVSPRLQYLGNAVSGDEGIVRLNFPAGKESGTYTVVAHLPGADTDLGRLVYKLQIRRGSWVLFLFFGLAGGLGLFLYGMGMMSSSLQRSAGGRMRAILSVLTVNRFVGVAVGAFVTMLIQSSSATTVMLVSFVRAQLMTFPQTLGVILGADIGTTVTAQLIAFKVTDYALLMIAIGFGLRILSRGSRARNLGETLLGFGLLFFGMHVMSDSMEPLRTYQPFIHILTELENPWLAIMVGTLFTALIQSSAAFIGIVLVLGQQGLLSLTAGIPLMFGANIGTCITALLAAIGASTEARRVAVAHTLFKVLGVLLVVWWVPTFADFVRSISPGNGNSSSDLETIAVTLPRQIANAHTIFNVGLAFLFVPFTGLFARFLTRLIPDRPAEDQKWTYQARHLDKDMIGAPSLALNLAKVEILRLGEKVKSMTIDSLSPFLKRDPKTLEHLHEEEEKVDALDEQITAYLLQIGKQELSDEQAREVYMMLHVTKQFEHMADIIDKQIRPLALKMIAAGSGFSDSGRKEVERYHLKVTKQISRALETFREESLELAQHMREKQRGYVSLEEDYRQAHFERIHNAIVESIASSNIHLELMDCYRRISSYSTNVGRAILTMQENRPDSENG